MMLRWRCSSSGPGRKSLLHSKRVSQSTRFSKVGACVRLVQVMAGDVEILVMYGPRRDMKERGWRCWFPSRLSWLKWYSMAGQVKNYNGEQWSRGSEAQTWTSWNGCTSPSHASESESRVIDHLSPGQDTLVHGQMLPKMPLDATMLVIDNSEHAKWWLPPDEIRGKNQCCLLSSSSKQSKKLRSDWLAAVESLQSDWLLY